MERVITLHIEKLPEGVYLATSGDVQGLIAQVRTVSETLEIARDVARKLMELHDGTSTVVPAALTDESFDYPLIVSS